MYKLCVIAAITLAFSIAMHMGINALNNATARYELVKISNNVLQEQIEDMQFALGSLRAERTYDEGVEDGIKFGKDQMYTKGYHQGMQHAYDHRVVETAPYTFVGNANE